MYKLTYDSEDEENEEVNAKTEEGQVTSYSDPQPDPATKPQEEQMNDAEKKKEKALNNVIGRTKDNARYEGNGRFYSLFANDNFLTEDPKASKKNCGFGLKMVLLSLTMLIMIAGIICLILVVSNLRAEQHVMLQRIELLEDSLLPSALSGAARSPQTDTNQVHVDPPLEQILASFHGPKPNDLECCHGNQDQISVLRGMMAQQAEKFDDLQTETQRRIQSADVRFAEILRKIGVNTEEIRSAMARISGARNSAQKAASLANSAKNLALLSLEDSDIDEEKLNTYLENVNEGESIGVVAFGVAHALAGDDAPEHDGPVAADEGNSGVLYDVQPGFSPAISFDRTTIGNDEYIVPESGVFHVPEDGTYVIIANLCVKNAEKTIVHLVQDGIPIREMEMSLQANNFAPIVSPISDEEIIGLEAPSADIPPPPPPDNWEDSYETHILNAQPPPTMDEVGRVQRHQFTELIELQSGQSLYLKLFSGRIVEYRDIGSEETSFERACNRFSGYRLQ